MSGVFIENQGGVMTIKAIVFDLKDIFDFNDELTIDAFVKLGAKKDEVRNLLQDQSFINNYLAGILSVDQFRAEVVKRLGISVNNDEFDEAWCAKFLHTTKASLETRLESIDKKFREYDKFVLSNLGQIEFTLMKQALEGMDLWGDFCRSIKRSFFPIFTRDLACIKPNKEAYLQILQEGSEPEGPYNDKIPYKPEEVIFVERNGSAIATIRQEKFKVYYLMSELSQCDLKEAIEKLDQEPEKTNTNLNTNTNTNENQLSQSVQQTVSVSVLSSSHLLKPPKNRKLCVYIPVEKTFADYLHKIAQEINNLDQNKGQDFTSNIVQIPLVYIEGALSDDQISDLKKILEVVKIETEASYKPNNKMSFSNLPGNKIRVELPLQMGKVFANLREKILDLNIPATVTPAESAKINVYESASRNIAPVQRFVSRRTVNYDREVPVNNLALGVLGPNNNIVMPLSEHPLGAPVAEEEVTNINTSTYS